MLKRLWRSPVTQNALGSLLAGYLRLVQRTAPELAVSLQDGFHDPHHIIAASDGPLIIAFWHGQHFMMPFLQRPGYRAAVLISKHADGEVNAIAAAKFGIHVLRGSGAQRKEQIKKRGGAAALRALLSTIDAGEHVLLTADVPKISRLAGDGILTLARLTGRPILPVAVVTSRALRFKNWDYSSIGLPFGRSLSLAGDMLFVPRDATPQDLHRLKLQLETRLDAVQSEACHRLGGEDLGGARDSVCLMRAERNRAAEACF